MLRAKEIFLRAVLDSRAKGSSDLLLYFSFPPQDGVTTLHIHFICVPLLPQRETGEAWEPVNTEVILNICRISSYRAVRLRYKDQSVAVA